MLGPAVTATRVGLPHPVERPWGFGRGRAVMAVALTSLGLLAAGCGGSAGGGHDSPEAAVRGFVAALQSNDLGSAAQWVAPSERSQFQSELSQLSASGLHFTFHVRNFDIVSVEMRGSDHALVQVRGDVLLCTSGSLGGQSFSTCQPQSVSPTRASDAVDVVKEQGQWWVSIKSTVGAQPSSSASSATSTEVTVTPLSPTTPPVSTGTTTKTATATSSTQTPGG